MKYPKFKNRVIRYDRILIALAIIIVLLVIMVRCTVSCSKSKSSSDVEPATTTPVATETTEEITEEPTTEMYQGAVYLSPSLESENVFYSGNTNEEEECRKIASKVASILSQNGLTVLIASSESDEDARLKMSEKPIAAYVAIHTNQGIGTGTDCIYNAQNAESKALAQDVYDLVAELTTATSTDNGLIDGSATGSDNYTKEIADNDTPCCKIEIEYHDGTNVESWILSNEDAIADSIANGICNYLNIPYENNNTPVTTTAADEATDDTTATTTTAQLSDYNG